VEALGLLDQISPGENDRGAEHRGEASHLQRVVEAAPAAAIHVVEVVILERRRQIVRPEGGDGCEERDADDDQNGRGDQRAGNEREAVDHRVGLRVVGDGACRERGRLAALHILVDDEREHCRQQKDQSHHRAHAEVLLTDHLLVDVGREHVVLAADHFRHAEVGDDEGEDDERRADEPVARAGDSDRPEGAPGARLQRIGGLVEPRIGGRQRGRHDNERVRERPEHLADHDADGTIDGTAEQHPLCNALVAEQVDEADGRQEGRRE